jgi:hypothetical protein
VITTAAENDWLFTTFNKGSDTTCKAWIGGSQAAGSSEPGGGWGWVTGEPWSFLGWTAGEPSNYANSEDRAEIRLYGSSSSAWNDAPGGVLRSYYLVEFEAPRKLSVASVVTALVPIAITGESQSVLASASTNGPDFVVTSISITPELTAVGGHITAMVTVLNKGNQSGSAGTLCLWMDKAETATVGESDDKSAAIGTLMPTQLKTLRVALIAPPTWGTFTLRAFVDAKNITAEADESNNQKACEYATGLPEFEILDVRISPEIPTVGQTFTAYVIVTNSGEVAGDGGYLDLWADSSALETRPVPGSKTEGDAYKTVGTLQPGQEKSIIVTGLKVQTATTAPVLGVLIDSRAKTQEQDEENNLFTDEYECE